MATANPMAFMYIGSDLARSKMSRFNSKTTQEEEPPVHVQYAVASEAEQVSKLSQEVESLKVKLDFVLRQLKDSKTAQNAQAHNGQGGK